ncbi:1-acyl-sn-glycerol-3-phosphate acyltransferase [Pseudogulbenkiania sp. MAI-1]|uniref:lysophospholipid acyltransferase family protein n=1 Tax=Pseudogulbenkiania sp. MAI-1 TaxID=990370 RepID=UPI00045E6ACD|nr:lysophospholipid acyltransferase family protein [Pseudogulbenkiania sp. MAI-1]
MRPTRPTSLPTRCYRLTRMGWHIAVGLAIVATRFPRLAYAERAVVTQRWSRQLLKILGITVEVSGDSPGFYPSNTLLVANHVSWLDIFVLNSATVSRFVAKQEIRRWPVAGWLVSSAGTVFIDRNSRRDASRVNQHLARALENGGCMAVFPEATTSDGSVLLPFKPSLFESVRQSRGTVQPVALNYRTPHDTPCTAAAYAGDTTFLQSLGMILATPAIRVELRYGNRISADGDGDSEPSRFQLAEAARAEIARGLRIAPVLHGTAARTPADPPA